MAKPLHVEDFVSFRPQLMIGCQQYVSTVDLRIVHRSVALLLLKADLFIEIIVVGYGKLGAISKMLLWPVSAVLHLVGPGPNLGPPEKHMHEWTLVQDVAVAVDIGLSWVFYSSLVFLIIRLTKGSKRKSA